MFIKYIGKYLEFNIIFFLSIQDIFNYMYLNKHTYELLNNLDNKDLIKFDQSDFIKHIIYYLKYNKIDRIVWSINRGINFNKNIILPMALLYSKNIDTIIFILGKYGFYNMNDLRGIEYFIIHLMIFSCKSIYEYNTSYLRLLIKEKNKDVLSRNPFLNNLLIEIFLKKKYKFHILNRMFLNKITKKLFIERVNKRKKYLGNFTF
jgi:hypothetical protein